MFDKQSVKILNRQFVLYVSVLCTQFIVHVRLKETGTVPVVECRSEGMEPQPGHCWLWPYC